MTRSTRIIQYSHQNRSWSARPGRCSIALKHSSAGIAYPNSNVRNFVRSSVDIPEPARDSPEEEEEGEVCLSSLELLPSWAHKTLA
jgi:hypothetical protein